MICEKCGADVGNKKFCTKCGSRLEPSDLSKKAGENLKPGVKTDIQLASIMKTIDDMCLSMPKGAVKCLVAASILLAVYLLIWLSYPVYDYLVYLCAGISSRDPYYTAIGIMEAMTIVVAALYGLASIISFKSGNNEKNGFFCLALGMIHVIGAFSYEVELYNGIFCLVVWVFCLRRVFLKKKNGANI